MKSYGSITTPLTTLLKKNSFTWNDESTQAFATLKAIMVTPTILGLPNLQSLMVECDALGCGLETVLMQEG